MRYGYKLGRDTVVSVPNSTYLERIAGGSPGMGAASKKAFSSALGASAEAAAAFKAKYDAGELIDAVTSGSCKPCAFDPNHPEILYSLEGAQGMSISPQGYSPNGYSSWKWTGNGPAPWPGVTPRTEYFANLNRIKAEKDAAKAAADQEAKQAKAWDDYYKALDAYQARQQQASFAQQMAMQVAVQDRITPQVIPGTGSSPVMSQISYQPWNQQPAEQPKSWWQRLLEALGL